jgi:hypothetical protein
VIFTSIYGVGYTGAVAGPGHADEFRALRYVIAQRGTARVALQWAGLATWAALLIAVLVSLPYPVAAVLPLLVLAATFELARGLHLGVERIGRYLQVFHEQDASNGDGPRWEHVAMALGPRVPGAGGHPLALPFFLMATVANGLAVILPGPQPIEWATMLVPHVAFIAWMLACDRRMRAQREQELAALTRIKTAAD